VTGLHIAPIKPAITTDTVWYIVTNGADSIVIACLTTPLLTTLLWEMWPWSFETLHGVMVM